MRVNTYILLLFSVLFLFAGIAVADSSITLTPLTNQITPSEEASYSLRLQNNDGVAHRYTFYSFQTGWNVEPSPLRDKIIQLPPGGVHTTKIVARPTEAFPPGIYTVSAVIENVDQNERYPLNLKIYLAPDEPRSYLPSIKVDVDMDEKITPTEAVSIRMNIENRNPLDLSNLKVRIRSEIPEFVKEATVAVPPLGEKQVEFTITPNEFQQPKEYTLFFVFEHDGKDVKVVEKKIEVVTLTPEFEITEKEDTVFLKKFTEFTFTNKGNVRNTQQVTYPTSFWEALFTTGVETFKEGSLRYFVWEIELQPNESTRVQAITNYRILLYLLVVFLLFSGFYLYARSPVILTKTAMTSRSTEDGALSEIKIRLELQNKSKKTLHDVSIVDIVPAIANVEESLELGTLKPVEIKHLKHGTKVRWSLAELDVHEHRLITYKVRAKLNILGVFRLPRGTVLFSTKKGRKRKAYSNFARLGEETK